MMQRTTPLRTNNKYFPNSIGEWSSYTTTVTAPENAVGFSLKSEHIEIWWFDFRLIGSQCSNCKKKQ